MSFSLTSNQVLNVLLDIVKNGSSAKVAANNLAPSLYHMMLWLAKSTKIADGIVITPYGIDRIHTLALQKDIRLK